VHGGAGSVVDAEQGSAVFAQLSPPDLVARAMARLVAEPNGPRSEKLRLSPERFGSVPRVYIECTEDRTIPQSSQRKMQALVPGAKVVTLPADHSPFLSCPKQLAEALIGAIP
jgi:pimeloyl-ACP methyl ester carboxylesterase